MLDSQEKELAVLSKGHYFKQTRSQNSERKVFVVGIRTGKLLVEGTTDYG